MKFEKTSIAGVWAIKSMAYQDKRGEFSRLFCTKELQTILDQRSILQINQSITYRAGAVRGFHYQNFPTAEMKIVRCLKGRVFDVAVDLRKGSQTFLKWTAVQLTPENGNALVIPEGCAHGLQVLEADSQLLYLHTALYTPENEGAIRFDEPKIAVDWPMAVTDISVKDLSHPHLNEDFAGIVV